MANAVDSAIWQRASESATVIVTKDEDFALRRHVAPPGSPTVVWIRFGNMKTRLLLAKIGSVWNDIITALERGELLIEVG